MRDGWSLSSEAVGREREMMGIIGRGGGSAFSRFLLFGSNKEIVLKKSIPP
jgi:hypothetical protein